MLREPTGATWETGLQRRWFSDDFFDLYVWSDGSRLVRFQLCYGKPDDEHAVTWTEHGLAHDQIDGGEDNPAKNLTPVLVPDGPVPWERISLRFAAESVGLDLELRRFVLEKLGADPQVLASAAHVNRTPAADRAVPPPLEREEDHAWRVRVPWGALLLVAASTWLWLMLRQLGPTPPAREQMPVLPPPGGCLAPEVPLDRFLQSFPRAVPEEPSPLVGRRLCPPGRRGTVLELPRRSATEPPYWVYSLVEESGVHVIVMTGEDVSALRRDQPVEVSGRIAEAGSVDLILADPGPGGTRIPEGGETP